MSGEGHGKLYIAGEYAVVEPGGAAIVVAVDRGVHVRAQSAAGEISSIVSSHYPQPLRWRDGAEGPERIDADADAIGPAADDHALAAVRVVEELARARGIAHRPTELTIASELDEEDGRKYGLGSSAAVTTAVVAALAEHYGLALRPEELVRAAMLAGIAVAPASSCGDIAASALGGWLLYRSPDRTAVAALRRSHGVAGALAEQWPGLSWERLPEPRHLRLAVGWTGTASSSVALVDAVREARAHAAEAYGLFLTASENVVVPLADALRRQDAEATLAGIRDARSLLAGLGIALGAPIETAQLAALCDRAERLGASAKVSGAGGGDCGIALLPEGVDEAALERDWRAAGIRRLDLRVAQPR